MNTKIIRHILYSAPHRLNDEHVEYLLSLIEDYQEAYRELDDKYMNLLAESTHHSRTMMGNVLGLILNKPELLYKEKDEKVPTAEV